jgi:transcription termination factor Rho
MYNLLQLNSMKVAELKGVAEQLQIANADKLKKQDLIYKILDEQAVQNQGDAPEPESAPTDSAPAVEATQQPSAEDRPKKERTRKPSG